MRKMEKNSITQYFQLDLGLINNVSLISFQNLKLGFSTKEVCKRIELK
jgi:hypothetical protein